MKSKIKHAIFTIAAGEEHEKIYKITRPSIVHYSNKVSADFVEIRSIPNGENPKLSKFSMYDLLEKFDRLIYLDSDIIINRNCPNLFDMVPIESIGATCESSPFFDRNRLVKDLCNQYEITYPGDGNYNFINTGVMVVSRVHRHLFQKPKFIVHVNGLFDQPYINAKLIQFRTPIYDLGLKFNHTGSLLLRGARPFGHGKAFMVHATGALLNYRAEYLKFVTDLWNKQ